jgi:hypothetical protein
MKIKTFLLILIISLITNHSFAKSKCNIFYDKLKNNYEELELDQVEIYREKNFGFDLQTYFDENSTRILDPGGSSYKVNDFISIAEVNEINKKLIKEEKIPIVFMEGGDWQMDKSKLGYYKVGKVYTQELAGKIKPNDLIISIDKQDIRNFDLSRKKNYDNINYLEDNFKEGELVEIVFQINDKNRKYNKTIKTKLSEISYNESFLDFYLDSVFIDEKNGTTNISIETANDVSRNDKFPITKLARETLKYKTDDGNDEYYQCPYSTQNWIDLDSEIVHFGLIFDNLVYRDQSLFTDNYVVTNNFTDVDNNLDEDRLGILYNSKGEYKFKNNFNLHSFPFDKQEIKIHLYQSAYPLGKYQAAVSNYSKRAFLSYSQENKNRISGWTIVENEIRYKVKKDLHSAEYFDGVELKLIIERKSSYYIFKVIFPIILILMICWSAVWIDPKEIESRLTITIVCLLSLIAYNFVIDSDMPKLEYLTIMDYIILISYVYAAIPNFLSIYSFQLIKKNKRLAEKYEFYEKRYGLPSYILIIFFIIIINASSAPEHTNSMFAWAAMR